VSHLTSAARGALSGPSAGFAPPRKRASTVLPVPWTRIVGGPLVKKAANSQNSVRFQLPPERSLWHWAPSSLMPRNSPAALPGRRPPTKRASTVLPGPWTRIVGGPLVKKAANSQNSVRFQLPPERSLWHWAHSSLMPRNSRAVVAARFSGLPSLAGQRRGGRP